MKIGPKAMAKSAEYVKAMPTGVAASLPVRFVATSSSTVPDAKASSSITAAALDTEETWFPFSFVCSTKNHS